jgi:hypothetical protein
MKNYPFFKIEIRKYPKKFSKQFTIFRMEERWERILDDVGNIQYHYTYRPDEGQLFFTVQPTLRKCRKQRDQVLLERLLPFGFDPYKEHIMLAFGESILWYPLNTGGRYIYDWNEALGIAMANGTTVRLKLGDLEWNNLDDPKCHSILHEKKSCRTDCGNS